MRLFRAAIVLTAAAAIGLPASAAEPARPPDPAARPGPAPTSARVTLITGDQVHVRTVPGRDAEVSFGPGRGGSAAGAVISRSGRHTYVVPVGVLGEVARGRLDRGLFDVTGLVAAGYDDARSATLPVIVSYAGDRVAARTRAVRDSYAGAARTRLLPSIGARAVSVAKGSGGAFWRSFARPSGMSAYRLDPQVRTIRLDRRLRTALDRSVPQIGAPAAWQRGMTGNDVKVAVLDTGIDAGHPDLAGRVAATANFSESPDAADRFGHGTHVASILAGTGQASGGKYRGVAPDATLLNGKVLGDDGYGSESGIIAGMEWAAGQGAKVVNLSLGGYPTDGTDPMSQAVNTLSRDTGALFVVAAGNCYDTSPGQVSSPAVADWALAVGSLERDGTVSDFSCRGPREPDKVLKPEISAPGSGIVAARAAGTSMGDPVDEHYTASSGTSMATPHVAGAAALVAQRHPDWNGEQVRQRLISTADPQAAEVHEQGAGRVDADQATDASVEVVAAVLDYGFHRWPHSNLPPVTKQLTYRNPGTTPVTLRLEARAGQGEALPRLGTTELTVPAGGQASVDVMAEFGTGVGAFTGRILATPAGGGDPVVTTYGWHLESEMYDLTVAGINADGSGPDALVDLGSRGDQFSWLYDMVGGRMTTRVAPGSYALQSLFLLPATDTSPETITQVSEPEVVVDRDVTVTFDARAAKPVRSTVEGRPGLDARSVDMEVVHRDADRNWLGRIGFSGVGTGWRLMALPSRQAPATDLYRFVHGARLQVPPFRARLGDGDRLAVTDVLYGPRFTGTKQVVAVDAGTATPDDLAAVRGKLAVIERVEGVEMEQALAAEKAGAAAVVLFDPATPGPLRVQFVPGRVRVPVLATDRVSAGDLLGRTDRRVTVTGVAISPYVYETAAFRSGRIPDDPASRDRQEDFATVVDEFGAHGTDDTVSERRFGYLDDPNDGSVGSFNWLNLIEGLPRSRTSYVLGSMHWDHAAYLSGPDGAEFAPRARWDTWERAFRPGEIRRQRWFAPAATSGLPRQLPADTHGQTVVERKPGSDGYPSLLMVAIAPFSHGASQTEEWPYDLFAPNGPVDGTFDVVVRRDGSELVPSGQPDRPASWYDDVPADAADYQISMDARREARSWWSRSTRVRSDWWFRSAGGETELMPMLVADLDVPAADLRGTVRAGVRTRIDLTLRHQVRSRASQVVAASLELSYDGTTWSRVPLTATGPGRYAGAVIHPIAQAGRTVHLRLEGRDDSGGRVAQEITSAYGLR